MLLDSFEHAEADFAARLLIEARNEAETVITATEKSLRAPEFAEIEKTELTPDERQKISRCSPASGWCSTRTIAKRFRNGRRR